MTTLEFLKDSFCINKKFLVYNLILRNLKIRYRKSFLGMMWTVLIPAGSAVIFYVVLKNVMHVNLQNHFVLILGCQIAWTFFAGGIASGLESIVGNFSLLNKVPLPPQSLVIAETLTLFLNLILSLPVLLVAMICLHVIPNSAFIQYILLLIIFGILTYSISLLLGLLYVYLRDLRYLTALILQFWFYLTPILYTKDMIPGQYQWLLRVNPIGTFFSGFQDSINGLYLPAVDWLVIFGWTFSILIISQIFLHRVRYKVVEIA